MLVQRNGAWEHLTPNWYTEMKAGESWHDYAERSHKESMKFLEENYEKENVSFTLVLQEKPSAEQKVRSWAR